MNIKKTKLKSFRFWAISLLAVSTAAFSTSLVLSSCTTTSNNNDQEIKSDVTINKEPNTSQEVSADQAGGLTLTIEAKSEKGKQLTYQWYVNKGDGTSWQQIQGATSNSYTIPSSELETVKTEKTWQYKAEIKYNDGTDAKFESNTYDVKVKPAESPTNTISFTSDLSTSEAIIAGDDKVFNVVATTNINNATITYDWYLDRGDGSPAKVQSSTSSTYTLKGTETSNITEKKDWKLHVVAYPNSNNNLTATSKTCTITINPKTSGGTETPKGTILFTTNLDQTATINAGEDKTFSVLATTKNVVNPSITYDWYLDQKGDGSTYTSMQKTTSGSYTIPASLTKDISSTSTWNLKVVATVDSDSTITTTSNTCSITITPKTPVDPNPTPTPTPPTTPTDIINPRSYNSNGLTTVKYPQEKWIGNNEVSISIKSTPKLDYLQTFVASYLTNNANDNNSSNNQVKTAYTMVSDLSKVLNGTNGSSYNTYTLTGGTGWMLDYSTDTKNKDIVNYYLATNIHVLEASYWLKYKVALDNGTQISATVTIPLSEQTASGVDVYLSQPQYSETNANSNLKVPFGSAYDTAWHKTPVTIQSLKDSLIPIGTYTSNGTASTSTPYMMQINYSILTMQGRVESSYYFPTDGTTGTKVTQTTAQQANDIAVLKISDTKDAFSKFATGTPWTTMFTKMQTMFNVETDNTKAAKDSSYIARLNALLSLTASENYSKDRVKELFMFNDYNQDITANTVVSVAGFPGTSYDGNYVNFNSNTLSYSLISKPTVDDHDARTTIDYNYKGSLYSAQYSWANEFLMPNLDLMGGSSGSMTVDQDYKIMGIYWGVLEYRDTATGSITTKGVSTELYSYSNNNSILMKWLKYVETNDSNSKLFQLFTALKAKNYFS